MPSAISSSEGTSARQGSARAPGPSPPPRRLETMAITTGSVPMMVVGSAPPARWIAAASSR
jgi:hypothetical protein